MGWSGDPLRDYESYERDVERTASRLPTCFYCGEPIWGDFVFALDDRKCVCEDCAEGYEEFENAEKVSADAYTPNVPY